MGSSNVPLSERRILGAIIPYPGEAFYLKAVDRIDRLDLVAADFRSVVERFAIDEKTKQPVVQLPPGWTFKMRETDNDFVMADILANAASGTPIKFTVSVLGVKDWDNDLLQNVDRWRGQLELPPTDLETLKKEMPAVVRESFALPAYIFDATAAGMGPKTQAGASVEASNAFLPIQPTESIADPTLSSQLPSTMEPPKIVSYDKPADWVLQGPKPLRLLNFTITKEDRVGEIIVSWVKHTPLENASLWCQQVLRDADAPTIDALAAKTIEEAEDIPAGKIQGKLYAIRASDDPAAACLLVVAIPTGDDDMCLFVKLKCDLRMSEEEKSNLLSFVNSLRWEQ